jgi:hypothetical protein
MMDEDGNRVSRFDVKAANERKTNVGDNGYFLPLSIDRPLVDSLLRNLLAIDLNRKFAVQW